MANKVYFVKNTNIFKKNYEFSFATNEQPLSSSTNKSFKSQINVDLSTSESQEAMFNILLKQRDKQINYKVTSDIVINHNLLVELCFIT